MSARSHAKVIWEYLCLNHHPQHADVLVILGCRRKEVAEHGASLWRARHASHVVCSGDGHTGNPSFDRPEAHVFADICREAGVPPDRVLIEDRSTNTLENIDNTRQLLDAHSLVPRRVGLVTLAYHERRALATARHRWPGVTFWASSPAPYLESYLAFGGEQQLYSQLVGSVERIIEYSAHGLIEPQEVPQEVRISCAILVEKGFVGRQLKPETIEQLKRGRT